VLLNEIADIILLLEAVKDKEGLENELRKLPKTERDHIVAWWTALLQMDRERYRQREKDFVAGKKREIAESVDGFADEFLEAMLPAGVIVDMIAEGGPGSGHHGHKGIPGQRGGSIASGGGIIGSSGAPSEDEMWEGGPETEIHEDASEEARALQEEMAALDAEMSQEKAVLDEQIQKAQVEADAMWERSKELRDKGGLKRDEADEYRELRRKMPLADKDVADLQLKRDSIEDSYRQRARDRLNREPGTAEGVPTRFRPSSEQPVILRDGFDDYNKLVGHQVTDGQRLLIYPTIEGRSFHAQGTANMSSDSGKKTMIHEAGHWLEHKDANIHTKALAFYDRRTSGEKANWLGDSYAKTEVSRSDKFPHPYSGKDYQRKSTEIVSMGLEHLYANPLQFARKDPDYFTFMVDLVRGK